MPFRLPSGSAEGDAKDMKQAENQSEGTSMLQGSSLAVIGMLTCYPIIFWLQSPYTLCPTSNAEGLAMAHAECGVCSLLDCKGFLQHECKHHQQDLGCHLMQHNFMLCNDRALALHASRPLQQICGLSSICLIVHKFLFRRIRYACTCCRPSQASQSAVMTGRVTSV